MNGRDDDYEYSPPDDYRPDEPPPGTRSDVHCPYCGGELQHWHGYYCGQCDMEWDDEAGVSRSHNVIELIFEQMTGGYD